MHNTINVYIIVNSKELQHVTYNLRVEDYRVFYQIDDEVKKVYIFYILTSNKRIKNMEEFDTSYQNFN
jgi:mRNA-degrading endonuclease RelE of RelBE toxin-antitoxin system